jgi:hypothetical protein
MKMRLLLTLISLAVSPVVSAFAQEQNAVDPEVRQQIEAAVLKYQEACSNYDAAATAALFTLDAVEVVGSEMADAGSLASGREAIEKRYAAHFASVSPGWVETPMWKRSPGLRRTRCGQTWENESLPAGLRNLPTLPRPTASFSAAN